MMRFNIPVHLSIAVTLLLPCAEAFYAVLSLPCRRCLSFRGIWYISCSHQPGWLWWHLSKSETWMIYKDLSLSPSLAVTFSLHRKHKFVLFSECFPCLVLQEQQSLFLRLLADHKLQGDVNRHSLPGLPSWTAQHAMSLAIAHSLSLY